MAHIGTLSIIFYCTDIFRSFLRYKMAFCMFKMFQSTSFDRFDGRYLKRTKVAPTLANKII